MPLRHIAEHEIERGVLYSRVKSTIHHKLGEWKECRPIVLLIITIEPKVLFKFLIGMFRLSIGLWMISGGGERLDRELFP